MEPSEVHVMTTELFTERKTMRYTCPVCQRCMEDGPDGLRLLFKGDQMARHVGGVLKMMEVEIEAAPPEPPRVLH